MTKQIGPATKNKQHFKNFSLPYGEEADKMKSATFRISVTEMFTNHVWSTHGEGKLTYDEIPQYAVPE